MVRCVEGAAALAEAVARGGEEVFVEDALYLARRRRVLPSPEVLHPQRFRRLQEIGLETRRLRLVNGQQSRQLLR